MVGVLLGQLGYLLDSLLYHDGGHLVLRRRCCWLYHRSMEPCWGDSDRLQPVLHRRRARRLQGVAVFLRLSDALFDHVQVPRPAESLRPIGPVGPARLPMRRRHPSFRHLLDHLDCLLCLRQLNPWRNFRWPISKPRCLTIWLPQHVQECYWRYRKSRVQM